MTRWIPKWVPWKRAFVWWWPFVKRPTTYIPSVRRKDPDWVERTKAHEDVHVRQWLKWGRWGFVRRYFFDAEWRLHCEAEAFAQAVIWWLDQPDGVAIYGQ